MMLAPPAPPPPPGLDDCLLKDGLDVLEPLAVRVKELGSSIVCLKDDPRGRLDGCAGGGGGEFVLDGGGGGGAGAADGGGGGGGGGAELGDDA
jgi:hypothetical protein